MSRRAERGFAAAAPVVLLAFTVGLAVALHRPPEPVPPWDRGRFDRHAERTLQQVEEARMEQLRREMLDTEALPLGGFVDYLAEGFGPVYQARTPTFLAEVEAACPLPPDADRDAFERTVAEALLLQDLIRVPYSRSHDLENTYVIQNYEHSTRRSAILRLVDEEYRRLDGLEDSFEGGGGAADGVVRVPELFLADLLAEEPAYTVTDYTGRKRRAYTFGDCDEFEMAYVQLLGLRGIEADVFLPRTHRRMDHVRTRFHVEAGGGDCWFVADTTRGGVEPTPDKPEGWEVPREHYDLAWIQRHAHAPLDLQVGPEARARVDDRYRHKLRLD